jgi:hypothetical protein
MANVKACVEALDAKADIYIWMDRPGLSYEGARHPYGGVMVNQYAFDMLKPLLLRQSYVNKVEQWTGQEIQVDVDKIRESQVGMPHGHLGHWLGIEFPDMQADLSQKWLTTDPNQFYLKDLRFVQSKILINRTSRFLNPMTSYFFMEKYRDRLIFIGTEEERNVFAKEWHFAFDLEYLKVDDFHHLAAAMRYCKFFIGNQSMCFAIAEALKVPRILELCPYAQNIHPCGPYAHYFQFQKGLVYLVDKLDKEL